MSDMYNVTPTTKDDKLGPKTKQALREARWWARFLIWLGIRAALK